MRGAIPPLLNTPSRRGAQLKHRDKFTLTLSLPLNIGPHLGQYNSIQDNETCFLIQRFNF
jgi:hypothetical protein